MAYAYEDVIEVVQIVISVFGSVGASSEVGLQLGALATVAKREV